MKTLQRLLILLALAAPASAQQGGLQPGEYLDGLGGYLLVKPATGGGLPFVMETVGGNRHSCHAEGAIGKNGQARLTPDGGGTCNLIFGVKPDGIEVTIKDQCSGFCGARASLDGMYFKPQPGCDRAGVRKARAEFKRLYDKKVYADARAVLEPVLTRCSKTLDNGEDGWIRNDLAITQLRLGDPAACRKTLEPLAKDAARTDAEIRELPPSDADALMPIVRATRTNLKLCQVQTDRPK